METDESCPPDIVADNYATKIMDISLEYLGAKGQDPTPYNQFLLDFYTGNNY